MPQQNPIPPPPSGTIVDSDPNQQSAQVPPPPSGTAVDHDPVLTANPKGQGLYQMKNSNGQVAAIPYGNVSAAATTRGYQFASDEDRWRYAKDAAADPNHGSNGSLYVPVQAEQTPEGHRAAVYAREDATPGGVIGQAAIGAMKGEGMIVRPIGDLARVVTGDTNPDKTDYTTARNSAQEVGKIGAVAANILPGMVEAPVTATAALGSGAVTGSLAKVVGKHLGLNDAQSNLLADVFGIVGGVAGGFAGAKGDAALRNTAIDRAVNQAIDTIPETGDEMPTNKPDQATPVEQTVNKAVQDSGIQPRLNQSSADRGTAIEDFKAEQNKVIQKALHQGIQDAARDTAADAGVGYAEPETIRDAVGTTARAVTKSAQGDFRTLDQASGGRWQRFDEQIKNVQNKMAEVSGIDDDQYSNLEARRNEIETLQSQMIEDMKSKGEVDPAIADRALTRYKQGMALQDLSNALRVSTKRAPTGGSDFAFEMADAVDPDMFGNRLSKLNDVPPNGGPSRLEQALGSKEAANELIDHVDNARLSLRNITEPDLPTERGRTALNMLLTKNATPSKAYPFMAQRGQIDYNGAVRDFENLGTEGQQQRWSDDVPKLRKYIYGKAQWQNARNILITKAAKYGGAGVAAGITEELIRHLLFGGGGSSDENK